MIQSILRSQVLRVLNHGIPKYRLFHDEFNNNNNNYPEDVRKKLAPLKKFQVFQDSEQVILDVEEERQLREQEDANIDAETKTPTPFFDMDINLERGLTGVFEIEDLVKVLQKENCIDICVCHVPSELKYVDYICIVTGKSTRHMRGIAEYVRRVFKFKRHQSDIIPKIEGATGKDWICMDMGNIALHIFSPAARYYYDLESLWSVGAQFDDICNREAQGEEELSHLDKYSIYLEDLKPKTDS